MPAKAPTSDDNAQEVLPVEQSDNDPITALRDEMQAQFTQLKESFKAQIEEKDTELAKLKEQNVGLQRALVRSAVTDAPPKPVEKTEEELYKEKIDALAQKTIKYMELIS